MKKLKIIAFFIFIQIIVVPITAIGLIYYGPFVHVRDMVVTTAMTTMTHQYFATWFLSDEEIQEILVRNSPAEIVEEQALESIVVNENPTDGIELVDVSSSTYKGYLLIINDPSRVKLATAPMLGERGSTTSQIVEYYGGIGGINASGFADDALGTGGIPSGLLISNGNVATPDEKGYYALVGFNNSNQMIVSNSISYYTVMNMDIRDACTFGPIIVYNGYGTISGGGITGLHPRTAIGQRQDGTVLMLVIDGRSTTSLGATLKNVQDIMLQYGAYNAFNLDGGASSTMVYNEKVVNSPSDIAGERYVPCAWIITK